MQEAKKEFKVGQKWKTRLGNTIEILYVSDSTHYPVTDTNGRAWDLNGLFLTDEETPLDLIELIEDAASEDQQSTNKYPVAEVINALRDIIGDNYSIHVSDIEQHLIKIKDPEYQKYLELKAKFE